MGTKTSVTTVVTTVLITLITMLWILSMGSHRTMNIVFGVLLVIGLFAFAAAMIRGADKQSAKNKAEKL